MTRVFDENTLLVLLSLICLITSKKLNDDTLVELREGKIRGHILKSESGNDYYAFQEIPYAAPPLGENRFQPPRKVQPWDGVLNTTKNTKICYQEICKYSNLQISEDCLYINVYTPQKPGSDSEKIPVLLWIHGGGYIAESSTYEYYGPKYIMDHGVVVVTFNYRLGPFGFITTDDEVIPANIGLKDQKFAMEWVHENIHLFGGDSAQVTLVGESAGSFSVGLHILGQRSGEKELFRAAIMQSGSPLGGLVQQDPKEEAFKCGRNLDVNFVSNKSSDLFEILQKAPASSIFEGCKPKGLTVIEKEGDFSYAPLQSLIDGKFRKIPVMIGFNSEEWMWTALKKNVSDRIALDIDPGLIVPSLINISTEDRITAGKLLKKVYTNSSFENDEGAYCKWTSDNWMITAICKHVELIAPHVPTYFYQFSYNGKLGQGPGKLIPGAEQVAHAEDLHYIWDDGNKSPIEQIP
uniref:Carboxylic ester hydrolase n=1 Tax=Leptinotarsa decemlineata TaxID=7539 RepID=A0A0A7ENR9_LEPDE|nr:esterase [Leptinotarsa decemlineata]